MAPSIPLSVAPMMDVTDRHYRFFARLLSRHVLLYTEMVVVQAVIHGDRDRLLAYDSVEHPVSLQLGGDDPAMLAEAATLAEARGFDEVNLNVGCPSPRVQQGSFGVVLMRDPPRVARAVGAMLRAVRIPVTVKCRIGVDDLDRYEDLLRFVDVVAEAGVDRFTVHARKAWTKGLSPKQNRRVPPLRYADVVRLKADRPDLTIEINGGITSLDDAITHLHDVDAVMIGRACRDTPYLLAEADTRLFGATTPIPSRADVARGMIPYLHAQLAAPRFRLHHATRHLLPLFAGVPGARVWKRTLSESRHLGPAVIEAGLAAVAEAQAEQSRITEAWASA